MAMKPNFNKVAAEHGIDLIEGDRGAPENKGIDFTASQYVVNQNQDLVETNRQTSARLSAPTR